MPVALRLPGEAGFSSRAVAASGDNLEALGPGHALPSARDVEAVRHHLRADTLRTFIAAVSATGLRWFDRRDTWTADVPSKVLFGAMPSPRAAPSARLRSLRTKSG